MKRFIILALVLIAASVLAAGASAKVESGNPFQLYSCTKVNHHGTVTVIVPAPAVGGLTNAGCVCTQVGGGDEGGGGDNGGGDQGGGDDGGTIQPATLVGPNICSDGLPADAGKDGYVSALGNSNDDCDHSGDPRLNGGVDTRTRWPGY